MTANPNLHTHSYPNGLSLVAEEIADVRAASFQILLPSGAATEPPEFEGISSVLESVCYRGAGTRTARELSDAMDGMGIQRGGGADLEATTFAGSLLAEDLLQALPLYADIILRPQIPPDQVEGARELALQRLESIKDNPTQRLFIALARTYFQGVHGRSTAGSRPGIEAITAATLREDHALRYRPDGAIIGVAGRFDWKQLVARVDELFGEWSGAAPHPPPPIRTEGERYVHIHDDSAQEQIGMAWPDVGVGDPTFYASRLAVQVLGAGFSSRLFVEVREKRGLVYHVGAGARGYRGAGLVLAYAGTTPERRQECLDVMVEEISRMPQGVTEAELARARTGLLTSLVMQGESCGARAAALVRDQFMLGRARSLQEIRAAVERVTTEDIREHLRQHAPNDFTIVTLGPESVAVPQPAGAAGTTRAAGGVASESSEQLSRGNTANVEGTHPS